MVSLLGDSSDEKLFDLDAMRVGGGNEIEKTLLHHMLLTPHVHISSDENRMTKEVIEFYKSGEAGKLTDGPTATFFEPGNLVRLFPVPQELGFLTTSMAREHSGSNLTPGAVAIMQKSPPLLEIYSRGVKRVMDCFGVPLASQNPSSAAKKLLQTYEGLGNAKWGLCCLFYRLLASTYFLDPSSHVPLVKFYCKNVANKMAQNVTDTCGLRKAISYSQFIAKIHGLSTHYGTIETDTYECATESEQDNEINQGSSSITSDIAASEQSSESEHERPIDSALSSDSDGEDQLASATRENMGEYAGTRDIVENIPCVFTLPRSEKT